LSEIKKYPGNSRFLKKWFSGILLQSILIFMILSCSSDDFDSTVDASRTEFNGASKETTESISAIFLENDLGEFMQALQYVDEELYTALVNIFLTGTDQYTVLAPSNEAFFELYKCLGMTSKDISETGNPGLVRDILQYHVIKGRLTLESIVPGNSEIERKTFYGSSLTFKSDGSIEGHGSSAFIDVDLSDISASNGMVHVINEVLLPIELACAP
jgi:uncharacterized surface protein with fasciclin (FAS1) repeats